MAGLLIVAVAGWSLAVLFAFLAYAHWCNVGAWRIRNEHTTEMCRKIRRQLREYVESQYQGPCGGWEDTPTDPNPTKVVVDERLLRGG